MPNLVISGVLITAISLTIHYYVAKVLPKPYMDEIFHVDQMQRYCQGNFTSWNDKITTPPGLYLVSLVFVKPLDLFTGGSTFCNPRSLRLVNLVMLITLFVTLRELKRLLVNHGNFSGFAFTCCFFPLLYFFNLLYYTDVGSTLFVALAYYYSLCNRPWLSAAAGAISVLFRQTNIIWVCFVASLRVYEACRDARLIWAKKGFLKDTHNYEWLEEQKFCYLWNLVVDFASAALYIPRIWLGTIVELFWEVIGYLIVGGCFLGFLVWNHGSIVLGDQSAHSPCPHLAQLCYFAAFAAVIGWPYTINISRLSSFFYRIRRNPRRTLFMIVGIVLTIRFFTYDHPYLLADNRHYTFYIWRRWFLRHWSLKYFLVPLYAFGIYVIFMSRFLSGQPAFHRMMYALSCLGTLVPNRLMEFRYFIIPYVMWRLHVQEVGQRFLRNEFITYLAINAFILYMFLARPFVWSSEPDELQRFMW